MRRKDRERDAEFALEVIRDCEYATLATINMDGTPYCIPVSPAVIDGAVYFHCATKGQKLDNIARSNSVCISGIRYTNLVPDKFTTEYESAVAEGKCFIVTDDAEKIAALRELSEKYAKSAMEQFDAKIVEYIGRTCVCKIEITKITGKANMM